MRKIFLIACFILGLQATYSQIDFGIKGGINYNSKSIKDVSDDVFSGAKSKTGFHAGVWSRFKLPLVGLYIRPEVVYTQLSNEVVFTSSNIESKTTSYDFQKIDIPILVGKKVFKVAQIFVGPSFQYILDGDFDANDISEVNSDGFSLGLQFGAGVELGKLGLDVRWERALSDTESSLIDNNTSESINFDTRVNQIIIGLSYKF